MGAEIEKFSEENKAIGKKLFPPPKPKPEFKSSAVAKKDTPPPLPSISDIMKPIVQASSKGRRASTSGEALKLRKNLLQEAAKALAYNNAVLASKIPPFEAAKEESKDGTKNARMYSGAISGLQQNIACDVLNSSLGIEERALLLGSYIDLMQECINIGDFASAMTIYLGIDKADRLTETCKLLTPGQLKIWGDGKNLVDLSGNMKAAKAKMAEYEQGHYIPPTIELPKDIINIREKLWARVETESEDEDESKVEQENENVEFKLNVNKKLKGKIKMSFSFMQILIHFIVYEK